MRPKAARIAIATGLGALALAGLMAFSDLKLDDVERINYRLAGLVVTTSALTILLRSFGLWLHAPSVVNASWRRWLKLTARHQILFMLAPSGSGDLGFPALAKTMVGISSAQAARMIGVSRLRDAAMIVILLALALILMGTGGSGALAGAGGALLLLYFVDDIASLGLRIAARLMPSSAVRRLLENAIPDTAPRPLIRLARSLATALIWTSATAGLMLAFAAVGRPLAIGEALMTLAALNLIGAMAISVGNLGFAEAGVTGLLIGFGDDPQAAAATALLARPLMLVAMLASCATLDAVASISRGARH